MIAKANLTGTKTTIGSTPTQELNFQKSELLANAGSYAMLLRESECQIDVPAGAVKRLLACSCISPLPVTRQRFFILQNKKPH